MFAIGPRREYAPRVFARERVHSAFSLEGHCASAMHAPYDTSPLQLVEDARLIEKDSRDADVACWAQCQYAENLFTASETNPADLCAKKRWMTFRARLRCKYNYTKNASRFHVPPSRRRDAQNSLLCLERAVTSASLATRGAHPDWILAAVRVGAVRAGEESTPQIAIFQLPCGQGAVCVTASGKMVAVCGSAEGRMSGYVYLQRIATLLCRVAAYPVRVTSLRCISEDLHVYQTGQLSVPVAVRVLLAFSEHVSLVIPRALFCRGGVLSQVGISQLPAVAGQNKDAPFVLWPCTHHIAHMPKVLAAADGVVAQFSPGLGISVWLFVRRDGSCGMRLRPDEHATLSHLGRQRLVTMTRDVLSPARVRVSNIFTPVAWRNGEHFHGLPLDAARAWFSQDRFKAVGVALSVPTTDALHSSPTGGESVEVSIGSVCPDPCPDFAIGFASQLRHAEVPKVALTEAKARFNRLLGRLMRALKSSSADAISGGMFSTGDLVAWTERAWAANQVKSVILHGVTFHFVPDSEERRSSSGFVFPRFVISASYHPWVWSILEYPLVADKLQKVYHAALQYQRLLQLSRATTLATACVSWTISAVFGTRATFVVDSHGRVLVSECSSGISPDVIVRWVVGELSCMVRKLGGDDAPSTETSATCSITSARTIERVSSSKTTFLGSNAQKRARERDAGESSAAPPPKRKFEHRTYHCEFLSEGKTVWDDYLFRAAIAEPQLGISDQSPEMACVEVMVQYFSARSRQ